MWTEFRIVEQHLTFFALFRVGNFSAAVGTEFSLFSYF